jgi:hypothetical protein
MATTVQHRQRSVPIHELVASDRDGAMHVERSLLEAVPKN